MIGALEHDWIIFPFEFWMSLSQPTNSYIFQQPADIIFPTDIQRWTEEALKERLGIAAFATPEIATVLFLQERSRVHGWSDVASWLNGLMPKRRLDMKWLEFCGLLHGIFLGI